MKKNHSKQKNNSQIGFTLIETIVIVLILGIIGTSLSGVLTRTFRANTKSQVLGNVKQNGQNALNDFSQVARNAQDIVCVNPKPDGKTMTFKNKDGSLVRFAFIDPQVSKNGVIKKDYPSLINGSVRVSNSDDFCDLTKIPLLNSVNLTDDNISKGVSVEGGKFNQYAADSTAIYFEVKVAKNAPQDYSNQIGGTGSEIFRTTVQLR